MSKLNSGLPPIDRITGFGLHPDEPVNQAIRSILGNLLATIESSAQRVLAGTDPEDVHDLRVATRRTRTVLGQVPGVFEKDAIDEFKQGFRRIGAISNWCRDLDVWLEAIGEDRRSTGPGHPIEPDPLERLIRRRRDAARRQVAKDLRAPWFPALLHRWRTFLRMPPGRPLPPTASKPTAPVIAARILKAHRRLLKRASGLPEKPSAAQFHRLRIDGKKLRYLLEFFGGLFDPDRSRDLIEDLKRLQDALGSINDRGIQLKALDALEPPPARRDPTLILAIDLHRRYLVRTLRAFRSTFADEFHAFSGPNVTRSFDNLFEPYARTATKRHKGARREAPGSRSADLTPRCRRSPPRNFNP